MLENEAVFRRLNESVKKNLTEIKALAEESNQDYLIRQDDTPLHFYCECSDEDCRQRIQMKPSTYDRIHKNRNCFILIGGHQTKVVEKVVRKEPNYWVVEKHRTPPENVRSLQPTGVDNG